MFAESIFNYTGMISSPLRNLSSEHLQMLTCLNQWTHVLPEDTYVAPSIPKLFSTYSATEKAAFMKGDDIATAEKRNAVALEKVAEATRIELEAVRTDACAKMLELEAEMGLEPGSRGEDGGLVEDLLEELAGGVDGE